MVAEYYFIRVYILCYTRSHAHYNVIWVYIYYIEHNVIIIIIIIADDDRMRAVITRSAAVTQHVHTHCSAGTDLVWILNDSYLLNKTVTPN